MNFRECTSMKGISVLRIMSLSQLSVNYKSTYKNSQDHRVEVNQVPSDQIMRLTHAQILKCKIMQKRNAHSSTAIH